jgi:DNA-directed RNA polymerase subunit H (RpoH/RPB5)
MSEILKSYTQVLNSRKHLIEMLENRGYNVDHLKNFTEDEIKEMMLNHITGKFTVLSDIGPLDIFLEKKNDNKSDNKSDKSIKLETNEKPNEKIYVKYRLDSKFKGTANLTTQIMEIYEKHLSSKDTLIVLNLGHIIMKIGVKDKVDEEYVNDLFIKKNYFVQVFGLENFYFNVSNHQFVPKHIVLSKQEAQEVIKKYDCKYSNIPTIKRDDAQAKYLGLRPKQICKIIVENVSSGVTEKYRYCVH